MINTYTSSNTIQADERFNFLLESNSDYFSNGEKWFASPLLSHKKYELKLIMYSLSKLFPCFILDSHSSSVY